MKRRTAKARWSASFSMAHIDGPTRRSLDAGSSDVALAAELEHATGRVQFRFRFEGRSVNPSIQLADGHEPVLEFRALLIEAIEQDWDLDADGRPVPPGTAKVTDLPAVSRAPAVGAAADPAGGQVVSLFARPASELAEPEGEMTSAGPAGGLLGVGEERFQELVEDDALLETFEDLRVWRMRELAQTTTKVKRTKRQPATLSNADGELRFAATHFRSGSAAGAVPGSSQVLAGDGAIDVDGCIDLLVHRQHTNLQTRSRNESRLLRWAKEIERATEKGSTVPPLARPELQVEVADVRTIEAMARTVGAAFRDAYVEGRIESSPWTARVESRVESPPQTHFSQRHLPNDAIIDALVEMIGQLERTTVIDGRQKQVNGERFRVPIKIAHRKHLRPEELRGLRRSNLRVTPEYGKHLAVYESIVFVSAKFTADGSTMQVVTLKARGAGEERIYLLDDDEWDEIHDHVDRFLSEPDPTSDDRNRRDPLLFSTFAGDVVEPGWFNERWWRPVVEALAVVHPVLEGFRFRQLRHAGITRRILAGDPIDQIADDAGNSSEVIRRHYRGVIDAVARSGGNRARATSSDSALGALFTGDLTLAESENLLAGLTDGQLEELTKVVKVAKVLRSDD